MTYRFPPIVGAVAGFAFAALALWAEAIIFLEYRSADLAVASTGVLTTLSPNGECVGYAPPEDVEARYTGKTGQPSRTPAPGSTRVPLIAITRSHRL